VLGITECLGTFSPRNVKGSFKLN